MRIEWIIDALKTAVSIHLENFGELSEIVSTDELLSNNQAEWSPTDARLYISPAAHTLLMDPETSRVALDGLNINLKEAMMN